MYFIKFYHIRNKHDTSIEDQVARMFGVMMLLASNAEESIITPILTTGKQVILIILQFMY